MRRKEGEGLKKDIFVGALWPGFLLDEVRGDIPFPEQVYLRREVKDFRLKFLCSSRCPFKVSSQLGFNTADQLSLSFDEK